VLRAVVPPLAAGYAVFVAMVLVARRRPVPRPRRQHDPLTAPRTHAIGTTLGGYIAFLGDRPRVPRLARRGTEAFASAVWGGAFLSSVALAGAAVSAMLARRNAGRD
jgi:hypothetical protein